MFISIVFYLLYVASRNKRLNTEQYGKIFKRLLNEIILMGEVNTVYYHLWKLKLYITNIIQDNIFIY